VMRVFAGVFAGAFVSYAGSLAGRGLYNPRDTRFGPTRTLRSCTSSTNRSTNRRTLLRASPPCRCRMLLFRVRVENDAFLVSRLTKKYSLQTFFEKKSLFLTFFFKSKTKQTKPLNKTTKQNKQNKSKQNQQTKPTNKTHAHHTCHNTQHITTHNTQHTQHTQQHTTHTT